jgi:hypothetical protein
MLYDFNFTRKIVSSKISNVFTFVYNIFIFKKFSSWLGVVAHTCNPSYTGAVGRGLWFEASLGKKLVTPVSQSTNQAWWHMPGTPATRKTIGRGIVA